MDTREKIISLRQAQSLLEDGAWNVIVGLFDPLTAVQARRIGSHSGGKILAVVLDNPGTLLPADARCTLLAALRSIDFVVQTTRQEWHSVALRNPHVRVIDDLEEEKRRSEEFVERIISRQESAATIAGQNR